MSSHPPPALLPPPSHPETSCDIHRRRPNPSSFHHARRLPHQFFFISYSPRGGTDPSTTAGTKNRAITHPALETFPFLLHPKSLTHLMSWLAAAALPVLDRLLDRLLDAGRPACKHDKSRQKKTRPPSTDPAQIRLFFSPARFRYVPLDIPSPFPLPPSRVVTSQGPNTYRAVIVS